MTRDWAKVAEQLASPVTVNLWQIGAHRAWRGPIAGDMILLRLEGTLRDIVGYGRFIGTTCHAPSEAWDLFVF